MTTLNNPVLTQILILGSHSTEFYQVVGCSIILMAIMAVMGWIWLRDELKEKE
ncbi:MAG: hypothetical protein NT070_20650 [Cyanobacteria bacterium]|nr:hypothetical protein [Cyanobacteriota bacterium]